MTPSLTSPVSCAIRVCLAIMITGLLCAPASAFDPAAGDFTKPVANSIRVMTWNVHNNFIYTTADDGRYRRVIKAANPDVIAFQEIDATLTVAQIADRLESYFPGSTWHVYRGFADGSAAGVSNRNAIASRFPLSLKRNNTLPTSSIRGVTMALINLPDATYAKDLYLMSVHFKAGNLIEDHERRQRHADAITNWMRDARNPGEEINLPNGTPMMVVGDVNLNQLGDKPPYHPSDTMIKGNIYNHTKYGASSMPDWDGTENSDAAPYDHTNGEPYTHSSSTPRGRIDRFYYTDSVIHPVAKFVLNVKTMSAAARSAAGGLQATDTSGASDHLPCVVDFALGPSDQGEILINEYSANNDGADNLTFIEVINTGGEEINLDAPLDYWIKTSLPLPTTMPAAENEEYAWDLRGVVPPHGFAVLYDPADESSAIAATIESNLPKLQRCNEPNLMLRNLNYTAFSLVDRTIVNNNHIEEAIETYGFAAPDTATTRYFRIACHNALIIPLGTLQLTSYHANNTPHNKSVSRMPGNTARNTYANWTMGTPFTPGLANPQPSAINEWMLY